MNHCLTIVFVVWQLQQEVQDVDEGGELVVHLELTAQRNPEVNVSLQSCVLHKNTRYSELCAVNTDTKVRNNMFISLQLGAETKTWLIKSINHSGARKEAVSPSRSRS